LSSPSTSSNSRQPLPLYQLARRQRLQPALTSLIHSLAQLHRNLVNDSVLALMASSFHLKAVFRSWIAVSMDVFSSLRLVTKLIERLLCRMNQAFTMVLRLNKGFTLLVFFCMTFGVLDISLMSHPSDHLSLDTDLLFLVCSLVFCGYRDDTVGINVKGHFNLRHTTGAGGRPTRSNWPRSYCPQPFTLTLENPDGHSRLIIISG